MLRSETVVGLDIGTTATKLVALRRVRGDVRVVKTAVFNNWEEGIVGDIELAEHLGDWVRECGFGDQDFVLGVPQYLAIVQLSDFPPTSTQQLDELVAMETQQLAGLSDEAFLNGYQRLEPFEGHQNPVLIGVCRESVVRERLEPIEQGALDVADLAMEGQALAATYAHTVSRRKRPDGLEVLLDVGTDNTTMALMRDRQLVYVGSFTAGGQMFTAAMARHLGVSADEAERVKRESRVESEHRESPLTEAARLFAAELHTALEHWYYQGQTDDEQALEGQVRVASMRIAGGGAELQGLPEFLGLMFDCPVERLEVPGEQGIFGRRKKKRQDDGEGVAAERFAIAYGLALHGLGNGPETRCISLAPADVTWRHRRRKRFPLVAAACVLLGITLAAYLVLTYLSLTHEATMLKKRRGELLECRELIPELRSTEAEIDHMERMLVPFAARGNRNVTLVRSIELLSKYQQREDWLVFLADEKSYYGLAELSDGQPASGTRGESVFAGVVEPGKAPAAPRQEDFVTSASVAPWRMLMASGFTPQRDVNPWGNVRETVDALTNEPDSIFGEVDTLPATERSAVDYRIVPEWKERYGMKSFALQLPLKEIAFEPAEVGIP